MSSIYTHVSDHCARELPIIHPRIIHPIPVYACLSSGHLYILHYLHSFVYVLEELHFPFDGPRHRGFFPNLCVYLPRVSNLIGSICQGDARIVGLEPSLMKKLGSLLRLFFCLIG